MTIRRQRADHLFSLQAELGEGPVWDDVGACLWCVDIAAPAIRRFDFATGTAQCWPAPKKVGWVLPTSGGLVAGLDDGLYRFDSVSGAFELEMPVERHIPGNRINDATVGPDGTIWFGTMDEAESNPTGGFYRYRDGVLARCDIPPAIITNGPAVSADGCVLFTVDTLAGSIWAFALNEAGELGAGQLFAVIPTEDGYPDGVSCDTAGGLWVGVWGGGIARRYDAQGIITDEIAFPVSNVTKVALGGVGKNVAFVTTARKGLSARQLEQQPLAGDLFTFSLDDTTRPNDLLTV